MMGDTDYPIPESLEEFVPMLKNMGWKKISYKKGNFITDDRIYILLKGKCFLCSSDTNDSEKHLIYFTPGMMVNFQPALNKYLNNPIPNYGMLSRGEFTIRTKTNCEMIYIEEDIFIKHVSQNVSQLNYLLIRALAHNFNSIVALASNSKLQPMVQRVARHILENITLDPPYCMSDGITYIDIANQLSVHSITVSKVFRSLKEEKVVARFGRKIIVTDLEKLKKVAAGDIRINYRQEK